jgi:LacI family transcriptional regulator
MSDTVAVGAIRALKDLGREVPGDVSVVGFDGIDMSRFTVPRLTTVEQPIDEIARQSILLLKDMLENKPVSRHTFLPARFHKRESLSPAP